MWTAFIQKVVDPCAHLTPVEPKDSTTKINFKFIESKGWRQKELVVVKKEPVVRTLGLPNYELDVGFIPSASFKPT